MKWIFSRRRKWEQQMDAELRLHLENQVRDYIKSGLTLEDAQARARRDFGSVELTKDECRDERAFEPIDSLSRDLRYAYRSLRRSPGYVAAAILTLALGIGANISIFSALQGVVLQPLPYREPDRLVIVALYNRSLRYSTDTSYPDFQDWRRDARSFRSIAAFLHTGFDLTNPGAPQHVSGYQVSSGFFETLGVKLALGHSFSEDADRAGGMPAAVISYQLWQQLFRGSYAAIGRLITLNGADYTVTGVLPPSFRFEDQRADIYTLVGRGDPVVLGDRTIHNMLCVARLAEGIDIGQARAEMNTLQDHIDELHPGSEKGQSALLAPLKEEIVGDVAGTLWLLLGAVSLVLLIACANVANLLLARSAARARELTVRTALGASVSVIVRQVLTESLLLSLAGGLVGLAVARLGLRVILAAAPPDLPRLENIGINTFVLLFALGVSFAVGILFGLTPALQAAHADLQADIRKGGRGTTRSHGRAQAALVVAQIALSLILLSGAGLLFRSVLNLWAVNPGFDPQKLITFQIGLSPSMTLTPAATKAAYKQLAERIRLSRGIEAAGITALVPLSHGDNSGPFWFGAHPPKSMAEIPRATYYPISRTIR